MNYSEDFDYRGALKTCCLSFRETSRRRVSEESVNLVDANVKIIGKARLIYVGQRCTVE